MKRYIRSADTQKAPYQWSSPEMKARVAECVANLERKYPNATVVPLRNSMIYVIHDYGQVEEFVVDAWGHCGKIYGGLWEYVKDFLDDGGDINLVTFTDKLGNVYTPYKGRRSFNVTFTDGSSVDMSRGKAETLFSQNNK